MSLLEKFQQTLQFELNRSQHTIEAYIRDITQFRDWLCADSDFTPENVTTADIRAWLASQARKKSPLTLRRKTQSLRAFFHWMQQQNLILVNPAADIILAKKPTHLPEIIKEDEIEHILSLTATTDYKTARAHIILLMLYSLGLRQEELRLINDTDIDLSIQELKVTGKRNKQRLLPLPPALIKEIKQWQTIRDAKYPDLEEPRPLITSSGQRITKNTLYSIVHNTLAGTAAHKRSPHVLRHTFATTMLNHGSALDSVKEFLGHTSLTTTQIYTHLSYAQLRDTYSKAHPRNK